MTQDSSERARRALRAFLARRKTSLNALAVAADVSEGTLRAFLHRENPTHSLTQRTWSKLARAAGVSVAELTGEYVPPPEIPLWGHAGAGDAVHPFDGEERAPLEMVPAPPGLRDGAALIVRGDSMLPRWADGDVLFFETAHKPPAELLNRLCVLKLRDGPHLVKRLTPGTRRGRYHLVSVNPAMPVLRDRAVEWAAEIAWTRHDGRRE